MLFDKERIVVQAGKPVEIVFENTDLMPHNFVVDPAGLARRDRPARRGSATQPGAARAQLRAPLAEDPAGEPAAAAARVAEAELHRADASRASIRIVCTYPGHWRRMYGALYVVEDLDEYLADPEGYLAKHPLPIEDELLKFNRPAQGVEVRRTGLGGRAS